MNPAASRDDRLFAANSLVEIALQRGSFPEAETGLNLVARDTDDFQLHYRRGRTFEALGRLAEADVSYQGAIQRAGTDVERFEALEAVGFLALRRSQLQEAAATLRAAHDLEKTNVEVLHGLADVSMQQRDFTAASDWLRAALAIKPSRRDRAQVAQLALVRSDWPLAIEMYSSLLTDAGTPEERYQILSSLASAYRASGRPDDAEAAWRKALAIRETADGQRQLADLLEARGKLAEAAIALERSVILQPTAEGHTQLSVLYAKLKDPTQAIRHARDALAIADSAQLHQRLGYLYLDAGSLNEAEQEFEKASAAGNTGPLTPSWATTTASSRSSSLLSAASLIRRTASAPSDSSPTSMRDTAWRSRASRLFAPPSVPVWTTRRSTWRVFLPHGQISAVLVDGQPRGAIPGAARRRRAQRLGVVAGVSAVGC